MERPLLTDALIVALLWLGAFIFASTSNMGRPGAGYGGYVLMAIVAGTMMVQRHFATRRAVFFAALLVALLGIHSQWSDYDRFIRLLSRVRTEHLQKEIERLTAAGTGLETSAP